MCLFFYNYASEILYGEGAGRITSFACQNVQAVGLKIELFTLFTGPKTPKQYLSF